MSVGLTGKILNSIYAAGFEISALQMVSVSQVALFPVFCGRAGTVTCFLYLLYIHHVHVKYFHERVFRLRLIDACTSLTFSLFESAAANSDLTQAIHYATSDVMSIPGCRTRINLSGFLSP